MSIRDIQIITFDVNMHLQLIKLSVLKYISEEKAHVM